MALPLNLGEGASISVSKNISANIERPLRNSISQPVVSPRIKPPVRSAAKEVRFDEKITPALPIVGPLRKGQPAKKELLVLYEFSKEQIAEHLWQNPTICVSDAMFKKVNAVAAYLKDSNLVLQGTAADGSCYFHAFLGSYETLKREIPLLDQQQNKISYLRGLIVSLYHNSKREDLERAKKNRDRAKEIRKDKEWVTSDEGWLLANLLSIHIRTITVNEENGICGIEDRLTFPKKEKASQTWSEVDEKEKPQEYILIVDLGNHFVFAKSLSLSSQNAPNRLGSIHTNVEHKKFEADINEVDPIV